MCIRDSNSTNANSHRVASLQSGFSPPTFSGQPLRQTGAYPLYGPGTSGHGAVVNPPIQNVLPAQNLAYQNQVYSLEPPRLINQPALVQQPVQQAVPQMVPNSGGMGYPRQFPPQHGSFVPAAQGVYPGAQTSAMPWATQHPMMANSPAFRPDLGFRSPTPTVRNFGSYDNLSLIHI